MPNKYETEDLYLFRIFCTLNAYEFNIIKIRIIQYIKYDIYMYGTSCIYTYVCVIKSL